MGLLEERFKPGLESPAQIVELGREVNRVHSKGDDLPCVYAEAAAYGPLRIGDVFIIVDAGVVHRPDVHSPQVDAVVDSDEDAVAKAAAAEIIDLNDDVGAADVENYAAAGLAVVPVVVTRKLVRVTLIAFFAPDGDDIDDFHGSPPCPIGRLFVSRALCRDLQPDGFFDTMKA